MSNKAVSFILTCYFLENESRIFDEVFQLNFHFTLVVTLYSVTWDVRQSPGTVFMSLSTNLKNI